MMTLAFDTLFMIQHYCLYSEHALLRTGGRGRPLYAPIINEDDETGAAGADGTDGETDALEQKRELVAEKSARPAGAGLYGATDTSAASASSAAATGYQNASTADSHSAPDGTANADADGANPTDSAHTEPTQANIDLDQNDQNQLNQLPVNINSTPQDEDGPPSVIGEGTLVV